MISLLLMQRQTWTVVIQDYFIISSEKLKSELVIKTGKWSHCYWLKDTKSKQNPASTDLRTELLQMEVSNLMFYAQSTSTVLSGRIQMEDEEEKEGCEEKKTER